MFTRVGLCDSELGTSDKGASAVGNFLDVLEVRRRQLPFASATLLARLGDER